METGPTVPTACISSFSSRYVMFTELATLPSTWPADYAVLSAIMWRLRGCPQVDRHVHPLLTLAGLNMQVWSLAL
jgi:hypothetical protein